MNRRTKLSFATLLTLLMTTAAVPPSVANPSPSSTEADTAETDTVEAADSRAEAEALCLEEVDALHRFFQDWFNGELPETDEAFARFADALDDGFAIVSPSGRLTEKPQLLDLLRPAHGRYEGDQRAKVWIENAKVRRVGSEWTLVTYEEWQQEVDAAGAALDSPRGRRSTALLRVDADAPGGVRWLHVHETWLPE